MVIHPRDSQYVCRGLTATACENIAAMPPRRDTRRGRADAHRNEPKGWRPNDLYDYKDALAAAEELLGTGKGNGISGWINLAVLYLLGLRRDPPPRPKWAEERAARLPPESD